MIDKLRKFKVILNFCVKINDHFPPIIKVNMSILIKKFHLNIIRVKIYPNQIKYVIIEHVLPQLNGHQVHLLVTKPGLQLTLRSYFPMLFTYSKRINREAHHCTL